MKPRKSSDTKGKEVRRVKTFTGCWTCRSRKVKCDLGKPNCQRCEKSGLECGGYDIKLRWSPSIKFNKFGQVDSNGSPANGTEEPQSQRRNVGFVTYKDEYEFYEDMDEELSALHSPSQDKISDNKTWIIKKFGVFRGTENVKTKYTPRRKRRQAGRVSEDQIKKPPTTEIKRPHINADSEITSSQSLANLFDFDFSSMNFNGHEWIANELRDDALLSASAIQGGTMDNLFQRPQGQTSFSANNRRQSSYNTLHLPRRLQPDQEESDQTNNQLQKAGPADVDDISRVYKLLFHRNEDRSKVTQQAPVVPIDDQHVPRTIVPLDNVILINSSGTEGRMPKQVLEVVNSDVPDHTIFNLPTNDNILLRLPTTGLKVHGLTRFLMNYYLQNVVDLMTVVALPTNPWRTIYFPRAAQALGDIAGVGYTSNSRNSLLNAILAVSCFNLQSKFPRNSPEMRFYLQLGIEFRGQASDFLKACLASSAKQERYKDILTAILSMNSIDVVWGTMADCQYHLTLCEGLVEERMKTRPKLSGKARALHRIFSFLKLIQDSTALDKVQEREIVIDHRIPESVVENDVSDNGGEFKESLNKVDGKIRIEYVKQNRKSGSTPIFDSVASQTYYYPGNRMGSGDYTKSLEGNDVLSTDALYGLPNSIILLFSDCVRLARHREYYRKHDQDPPESYEILCAEFEKKLSGWTSEWDFHKPNSTEFVNDTIEGVYYHTMSFYQSLIIYYNTMARGRRHQDIQENVRNALTYLNKLTELINKGVKIVPLIWQGFIAGCSAIDTDLQLQYKEWAARLANSGMGSYWGARQIMFEVWRRRVNGENCDNWFNVYRDWEMNLMLS